MCWASVPQRALLVPKNTEGRLQEGMDSVQAPRGPAQMPCPRETLGHTQQSAHMPAPHPLGLPVRHWYFPLCSPRTEPPCPTCLSLQLLETKTSVTGACKHTLALVCALLTPSFSPRGILRPKAGDRHTHNPVWVPPKPLPCHPLVDLNRGDIFIFQQIQAVYNQP